MASKPVTVSQLNDYISRVLMTDPLLTNLSVCGEITNLKYHSTGHVYFAISDSNSKINCFFPYNYVKNLEFVLEDGMAVVVDGYINVYKKGGTYTLFVRNIHVEGEGDAAILFQQMKEKLEKEGLFDISHKKSIPTFPDTIGVVTSETGAAVKDIIKIITSRNNLVNIIIFPVQVQGEGAAENIAETIDMINSDPELSEIDTLIVGRGGGSQEDLSEFNKEVLARSIYNSRIPIISAVGHEIDFSISDFVADLRAETPTAAAEMAVPDVSDLRNKVEKQKHDLTIQLSNKLKYSELEIVTIKNSMFDCLDKKIDGYQHKIDTFKVYLEENNPSGIMRKGYSIISKDGVSITKQEALKDGEYTIHMYNGSIDAEIKRKDKK